MRRYACAMSILLMAANADAIAESPRWAFEVKGGKLHSAMEEWGDFYGDDRLTMFAIGVGYKPWRQVEIGADVAYLRDRGRGFAPGHEETAGDVRYQLTPVHLSLTVRGIFYEDQWLVPYIGAAAGRYPYRIDISGQERVTGSTGGSRYRAGLQLLLDLLEPRASAGMTAAYGVQNTYLFLEYQEAKAELAGSDLGGEAWLGGLLLEF